MRILFFLTISVLSFQSHSFTGFESSLFFYERVERQEIKPGVEWERLKYQDLFGGRQQVNIVRVDLNRAEVKPLSISGCGKVSKEGALNGALAAVNGTFFRSNCNSRNYFKIDGRLMSYNEIRSQGSAALLIDLNGRARMEILGPGEDPADVENGIGGFPQLVREGQVALFPSENTSFFTARHPRTGVGLTDDSHILILTVDGRSSFSRGLTLSQMAQFFYELGAESAMNLDGGGSTVMWVDSVGVVNKPSDAGGERSVTDALAVY